MIVCKWWMIVLINLIVLIKGLLVFDRDGFWSANLIIILLETRPIYRELHHHKHLNVYIYTEWVDLSNCLPFDIHSSIFIRWSNESLENIFFKLLILPSLTTPYGGGCYQFDMYIPDNYPNTSPQMKFLTTGNGKVRFNPNLYNNGKLYFFLVS